MKNTMIVGVALASTIFSFNAFSGTPGKPVQGSDNHVYAELSGGYSKIHNFDYQSLNYESLDDSGFAFSARIGMNFSTDSSWGWGYEIGYFNLAKAEAKSESGSFYTNLKLKQQGIDFLATFNKQFNEKVGVFAKAGLAVVSQDLDKESNVEANWSTDGSGVLPEIAGGVLVNLTDNLALTGTVNHLFGKSVNIHSNADDIASSTSGMLGLRYNIT